MNERCTVYRTTSFVGKKWNILLLLELYKGKSKWKRYSRIKDKLMDITPKVFSARLKELTEEGLIKKKVDASSFPIKCEYSLTESGEDFINVIKRMKSWALTWQVKNKRCEDINCKYCEL